MSDAKRPTLIQLPNGNWVLPEHVLAVVKLSRCEAGNGGSYPPRIRIDTRDGISQLSPCETEEEAELVRDKVAAQINAALVNAD
jgi:hypothetical protein